MTAAVAGFAPNDRMAPVGVLVRIVLVIARMLPVGVRSDSEEDEEASGRDESFKIHQC